VAFSVRGEINLHKNLLRCEAGESDKVPRRILRHANDAVTQNSYIKTVDADAAAALQILQQSLKNAPSMHLQGSTTPN